MSEGRDMTFEEDEIAVALLERLQIALENDKVSGITLNSNELRCMLRYVQDLIEENAEFHMEGVEES